MNSENKVADIRTEKKSVRSAKTRKVEVKKKSSLFNWLVPLLLILAAFLTLVLYTPEKTNKAPSAPLKPQTDTNNTFDAKKIASSLVSTFFNGSKEDKSSQLQALENTLTHLNSDQSGKTATALNALKNNNINSAIQALISLASQDDNLRESAKIWINIGNIQNLTSTKQALQAYEKASELDANNSNAWNRQGHIYRQLKQFDLAEKAYKKVRDLGNQGVADKAFSLANFGLLNQSKGKTKAAEKAFLEALEIYTKIENEAGIASTSESLASLYKNKNVFSKAEKHYIRALGIHKKLNNFQSMATLHTALGSLYQKQKETKKAQKYYEIALQISQENTFEEDLANIFNNLGTLAQQNGDLIKSKAYFEKSLALNNTIKRPIGTADQFGNLAIVNRKKRDFVKAEEFHKKAIKIYQENNHINGIISQKINLGFLYKAWQKTGQACTAWQESISLMKSGNDRVQRVEQLLQANCR